MPITNFDLARLVQTKLGLPYVYGSVGQVMTEGLIRSIAAQYPTTYTAAYLAKTLKSVGKQAFDCVGLIKFFRWGNTDTLKTYDPATDISANDSYSKATVKGPISAMPETPGLCVWVSGHIGVYIGNGEVIEARGVDYGVVKTKLKDRSFTHWLQYPGIAYMAAPAPAPATPAPAPTPITPAPTPPVDSNKPSDWATESWAWAKEMGYMDGTNPKGVMTREMVATLLYRLYSDGWK